MSWYSLQTLHDITVGTHRSSWGRVPTLAPREALVHVYPRQLAWEVLCGARLGDRDETSSVEDWLVLPRRLPVCLACSSAVAALRVDVSPTGPTWLWAAS